MIYYETEAVDYGEKSLHTKPESKGNLFVLFNNSGGFS